MEQRRKFIESDERYQLLSLLFGQVDLKELLKEIVKDSIKELIPNETPKYYTRKEVCKLFNISLPTLHQYVNSGKITALKIGGRTLFDADSINLAIQRKEILRYGRS